jgi:hypothetical protein
MVCCVAVVVDGWFEDVGSCLDLPDGNPCVRTSALQDGPVEGEARRDRCWACLALT